jgi:hypothetical protein
MFVEALEFEKFFKLPKTTNKNNKNKRKKSNRLLTKTANSSELDKLIAFTGYAYDPVQDIFYSTMNPWQRKFGYCRLFDQAAPLTGMIIDSEPIYFEYKGKQWMIGFWKGQYDYVTGGEVGVYTEGFKLKLPGIFSGIFYKSASDDELLDISFTLKKNGKKLFTREGKHWWLTGFKLGEFSEPRELSMDITITLSDEDMCRAFVDGLKKVGYTDRDLTIENNTVTFLFDTPRSPQPATRTRVTDWIIQRKNQLVCNMYQDITGSFTDIRDKLKALEEKSPSIYKRIIMIGRPRLSYEISIASLIIGIILVIWTMNRSYRFFR